MIKKFSVDPRRVDAFAAKRAAALEATRQAGEDKNEILREIALIEGRHAMSRRLHGGRWSPPPSDLARVAKLKADLPAAKARADAAQSEWQAVGGLADAVKTYATPRPIMFGGAMIKGFTTDGA